MLSEDAIDKSKLQAALTLQIKGLNMVFYLARLHHDGIYSLVKQATINIAFVRCNLNACLHYHLFSIN